MEPKPNKAGPDEILSDDDRRREKLEGEPEVLWENDSVRVLLPDNPAIPREEGAHIVILPRKDTTGDWRTDSTEKVLEEGYYALAAARTVADSGRSPDLWANVHWNSRPGYVAGCNVYGRNPGSEAGWGKPVTMREGGVQEPGAASTREVLGRFAGKYFPMWERSLTNVTLFPDGVKALDQNGTEFQEIDRNDRNPVLWANDKFVIVMEYTGPHLSGLHLLVFPRPGYWKPKLGGDIESAWQTPREPAELRECVLESMAILKSIQGILSQAAQNGELEFFNPEIHYSGNWARGMQEPTAVEGGQLDRVAMEEASSTIPDLRTYKKTQTPKFDAHMHGHLYATRSEDKYVKLPERPRSEVPEQWEGIQPLSLEEVERVRALISQKLSAELEGLVGHKFGD